MEQVVEVAELTDVVVAVMSSGVEVAVLSNVAVLSGVVVACGVAILSGVVVVHGVVVPSGVEVLNGVVVLSGVEVLSSVVVHVDVACWNGYDYEHSILLQPLLHQHLESQTHHWAMSIEP